MAKTITQIQNDASKFLARDVNLDFTSASTGLAVANRVYRKFAAMWDWPELNRKDITLATVTLQEAYSGTAIASYRDITLVEVQDDRDSDKYIPVGAANSLPRWVRAGYEAPGFPDLYRLENSAGVNKLALRPVPSTAQTANVIRVTGQITPAEVTKSSTTFCRNDLGNDVLALMIAAEYQMKRGQKSHGQELLTQAGELMQRIRGDEIIPAELVKPLE
jgi:hypothetical protein